MVTIFNRKELVRTYDMKRYARVKALLVQNDIDYDVRVISSRESSMWSANARLQNFSMPGNEALANEYIIYVKRKDYEKALFYVKESPATE